MKVLILGGGITGLSAAWFLSHQHPNAQITLLEKTNRLGGWIRTCHEGGFLFEQGPRTFPLSRSPHLLALIRDLGLPILSSAPQKRYLFHRGKLRALGTFIPRLIPYLIRELFISPSNAPDESIYDFAARRFSPSIAETLFDPLTLGIYAGDIRKLSLRSCFPILYQWEREKGSLLRGLCSAAKQTKGLFTIQEGMESLVHALKQQLAIDIVLNCSVEKIDVCKVHAGGKVWEADHVISALPPSLPMKSVWVVNLAFEGDVLPKKGYGYLVPSRAGQTVLGVLFDSSIFPQQNTRGETRLTVMLRAEEPEPLQTALSALHRHLGLATRPIYSSALFAQNAIPQFEVGCGYAGGISVDACIERGKKLVEGI